MPRSSFLAWDVTRLSLEMSIQLFFFLFFYSCYFCSGDDCICWWSFFTEVLVTTSLLKFPVLFSVCWPIVIIIVISCKFFKSVLSCGLSLESEWHQFSSGFQDSSKYSSSVVWIISIIPLISPVSFLGSWGLFQKHQLLLVLLSPPSSTAPRQDPCICLFFRFLLSSLCALLDQQNPLVNKSFSFY